MKLDKLIQDLPVTVRVPVGRGNDLDIVGLCLNSSGASSGFLFAALPGQKTHGIEYVASAAQSGAVAVLCESTYAERVLAMGLVAVISDRPHFILAKLASRYYAQRPRVIAAITGTNGKTSGTVFTRQIWTGLGYSAASFGTIGLMVTIGSNRRH
jgi:UDP-N-acetylmuramoyl-L-alanyl-D-glutamate--2,6-diaminopimelate ligase